MNKYSIQILNGADQDIQQAIDWYEAQKKDLGFEFYHKFLEIAEVLNANPFLYSEHYLFIRRAIMGRFPYSIFYAVDEVSSVIEIIAVLHQKMNPDEIRRRINAE